MPSITIEKSCRSLATGILLAWLAFANPAVAQFQLDPNMVEQFKGGKSKPVGLKFPEPLFQLSVPLQLSNLHPDIHKVVVICEAKGKGSYGNGWRLLTPTNGSLNKTVNVSILKMKKGHAALVNIYECVLTFLIDGAPIPALDENCNVEEYSLPISAMADQICPNPQPKPVVRSKLSLSGTGIPPPPKP